MKVWSSIIKQQLFSVSPEALVHDVVVNAGDGFKNLV